jgi:Domain of unknown function (DUF4349)
MWTKVLVLGLGVIACSREGAAPEPAVDAAASVTADAPAGFVRPAEERAAMSVRQVVMASGNSGAVPATQRMIVRSAEVTMQVADVRRVVQQVTELTASTKGFLGASRLWREGEADHATMTVRVPADALDATLAQLRALAVRVDNEAVTGEDVTRQAVDLSAQLTNLQATETELRALLVTVRQRTQKASDVLEVHTELSRVRGDIEQRTAELQTLTQLAALSTISLQLRPDVVATPIAATAWQPVGVLRDATRALVSLMRTSVNVLIWALVCGVPLAIVAAIGFGLVRALRRRVRTVAQA